MAAIGWYLCSLLAFAHAVTLWVEGDNPELAFIRAMLCLILGQLAERRT